MDLRATRRRIARERLSATRRFEKQKRQNLMAVSGRHKFIIVLDHLKPAFNIGKIFRSGDAFGAQEVHVIGTSFFDPDPAKGSFKYVPARFYKDFQSCYDTLARLNYTLFTLQPDDGELLSAVELPVNSAFIFGNEEFGLSFRAEDFSAVKSLKIPQYGRVQSLNVSIAASIVMYEYIRQYGSAPVPPPSGK
ncbi:MAG: TrmH family RNA methyltransferase [Deltaproteobacteria bacterium]|jgi:tRNA G18 (ribose-2'-O)-methylase SpoU|nr:TrmH family RNA methyltransferase [Deltaproteobacteria bacterium]